MGVDVMGDAKTRAAADADAEVVFSALTSDWKLSKHESGRTRRTREIRGERGKETAGQDEEGIRPPPRYAQYFVRGAHPRRVSHPSSTSTRTRAPSSSSAGRFHGRPRRSPAFGALPLPASSPLHTGAHARAHLLRPLTAQAFPFPPFRSPARTPAAYPCASPTRDHDDDASREPYALPCRSRYYSTRSRSPRASSPTG
jgi:hypothetical protein